MPDQKAGETTTQFGEVNTFLRLICAIAIQITKILITRHEQSVSIVNDNGFRNVFHCLGVDGIRFDTRQTGP